jgi:hypothetical protein
MIVVRQVLSRILLITLLALIALVSACGSGDDASDDQSETVVSTNGPAVTDDAAEPIEVSADELQIIEEWKEAGVPRFQDGEVLDFEPHASRIENGGTLLLDGVHASENEVIGFYRGALASLGWEERRVGNREMTAENDVASLLVTVNVYEEQTLIMMILTDRLGEP